MAKSLRHLVVILGDQLNLDASALADFDPAQDAIWMAEVMQESTHVQSSKQRSTLFLSAMRHFAQALQDKAWPLCYTKLDDAVNAGTLADELDKAIQANSPQQLVMTAPGDWRVLQSLRGVAKKNNLALDVRDDTYFFSTVREFAEHAKGRKQLRQEFFYRELRQKTGILMDGKKPVGGQWNFDEENRGSFGKAGPGLLPQALRFEPDPVTQDVMKLVNEKLASNPGNLNSFGWPVTREQALKALGSFIQYRLPFFGLYQDAMWEGEVWLYHSHIASALNLKLLHPKEVVKAAEEAYAQGHAPLPAVEGFIRQILGWREYVRGIYWTQMPEYLERNELQASAHLPAFYWTGETDMA
ncbi:MAG: cryptochrome/photolyase family protein, partial [Burkholderiales bacterium]|nr:cryptochrome/photolyase family protein [Burkholderiales bacterium]